MDLEDFIARKIAHSRAAFGSKQSFTGVLDHLKKEIAEVESAIAQDKDFSEIADEFVDCLFLSLEGVWRTIAASPLVNPMYTDDIASIVAQKIRDKLNINEAREWPDYRKLSPDVAREHDREEDLETNEMSYNNTKPLNLRAGVYYKDRLGKEHGPMRLSRLHDDEFFDPNSGIRWNMYGKCLIDLKLPVDLDLVEYVGSVPSDIPLSSLSG